MPQRLLTHGPLDKTINSPLKPEVMWGKVERCRDKKTRGLFSPPMLIPAKLFYKGQNVLLHIFVVFSCWENCFHITEAAADKYRKLAIGTGIIAEVRNRWIWRSTKEIKPSSNLPVFHQKQRITKYGKRKTQQPLTLCLKPFILGTKSQEKSRNLATHVRVKHIHLHTWFHICITLFQSNKYPWGQGSLFFFFFFWHQVMHTWTLKVFKLKVTNGSQQENLCSQAKKDVLTWAALKVLSDWIPMFSLRTISAFLEFLTWEK